MEFQTWICPICCNDHDRGRPCKPGDLVDRINREQAEIERLSKDAKRYRFLRDHFAQMHSPHMGGEHSWRFRGGWLACKMRGPTFDQAVDAAMVALEEEIGRG